MEVYFFGKEVYKFLREVYFFGKEVYKFLREVYFFWKEVYKFLREVYFLGKEVYKFPTEVYFREKKIPICTFSTISSGLKHLFRIIFTSFNRNEYIYVYYCIIMM